MGLRGSPEAGGQPPPAGWLARDPAARRRRGRALESNKAKQVAPEPDMRIDARRPASASASSTSPISGTRPRAGASRSLRPSCGVAERPAVDAVPALEHRPGRQRDARIDEQQRRSGRGRSRSTLETVAPALAARVRLTQAGRHVGARARPRSRQVGALGKARRHQRTSRRSAAAASAEPPPIPAATGRRLSSVRAAPALDAEAIAQGPGRAQDEIVVAAPSAAANGPTTVQAESRRLPRRSARRHPRRRRRRSRSGDSRPARAPARAARG